MTDTGWIVLGVLGLAIVAAMVRIVQIIKNKRDTIVAFEFSILNKLGAKFVFSPGDARSMLQEAYGALPDKVVDSLRLFNTMEGRPPADALQKIDKMVQDPERDEYSYRPDQLRLAYIGFQMLEAITGKQPLADPWRWPQLPD